MGAAKRLHHQLQTLIGHDAQFVAPLVDHFAFATGKTLGQTAHKRLKGGIFGIEHECGGMQQSAMGMNGLGVHRMLRFCQGPW